MIPQDRMQQITERFEFLEARMGAGLGGDEFVAVSREYAELRPVVEVVLSYQELVAEIESAEAMLEDPEMRELAEMELPELKEKLPEAEQAVKLALIPRDSADGKPALVEIRPGTGGDEAALFARGFVENVQPLCGKPRLEV